MKRAVSDLQAGVRDLRDAAARVAEEAGSAVAADVPGLLGQLETTLRDLSAACYSFGPSVVERPVSAASDPVSLRESAPLASRADDETVLALARLHELGAAVGGAARRCRSARAALAPKLATVSEVNETEPASPAMATASS